MYLEVLYYKTTFDDKNKNIIDKNVEDIPNKNIGPSSSPTASVTTLGVGGVSTPSSLQQPLHHLQLTTAIPSVSDSSSNIPQSHGITTSVSTTTLPSSGATSQLQARLSQPTLVQQQQTIQQQAQPQLRYLLERGTNDPPSLPPPVGAVAAPPGIPSLVSSSASGGGALVTTITSQLGVHQQMNSTVSSAPLPTVPLSSAQGVTTSHRVWVPGTTTTSKCSTHGSHKATVQCSFEHFFSVMNHLILPSSFTSFFKHTRQPTTVLPKP